MITVLNDVGPRVAAFEASGEVTGEEYKRIVVPHIDNIAKQHDKVSFLLLLNTDIGNYDLSAWMKDIGVGFKYFSQWDRLAVVSDQDWLNKLSEVMGYVIPGNVKSFKRSELTQAKEWVSG